MKKALAVITLLIIFGCTRTKEADRDSLSNASVIDSASIGSTISHNLKYEKEQAQPKENIERKVKDEGLEQVGEGCVFDTSTYKFTTEALIKYNKNLSFSWDKETSNALVKLNNTDSLILKIGGCDHFGYQATFITDSSRFDDHEFLFQKTRWLAKTFFSNGFDEKYVYCIDKKLYKLEEQEASSYLHYTIIDPDTSETNLIFDGWTFEKVGGKTRVNLVGYQN